MSAWRSAEALNHGGSPGHEDCSEVPLEVVHRQVFYIFLKTPSSGVLRRVALVRANVSEECRATIIRVTKSVS
jgi:hypothetical protein